jgi:hypothetical protein
MRYDFPSQYDIGDIVTGSTGDPSAFLNVVLDKPSEDQWTAITLSAGAARRLRDALCKIYPLETIGGRRASVRSALVREVALRLVSLLTRQSRPAKPP